MDANQTIDDSPDDLLQKIFEKALEAAEKSTQQGLETFEKALKDFEQAAPKPPSSEHSRRASH